MTQKMVLSNFQSLCLHKLGGKNNTELIHSLKNLGSLNPRRTRKVLEVWKWFVYNACPFFVMLLNDKTYQYTHLIT